jgi:hypothetical protein
MIAIVGADQLYYSSLGNNIDDIDLSDVNNCYIDKLLSSLILLKVGTNCYKVLKNTLGPTPILINETQATNMIVEHCNRGVSSVLYRKGQMPHSQVDNEEEEA